MTNYEKLTNRPLRLAVRDPVTAGHPRADADTLVSMLLAEVKHGYARCL